jgi:hypothetical protein
MSEQDHPDQPPAQFQEPDPYPEGHPDDDDDGDEGQADDEEEDDDGAAPGVAAEPE